MKQIVPNKKNPIIGIVGGLGPQAGVDLASKIIDQTLSSADQDHISVILISMPSIVIDRTQFLLGNVDENPGIAIAEIVETLERCGADVVGIPCNTAHSSPIFDMIKQDIAIRNSSVKLLNMVVETVNFVRQQYPNIKRVGVLSTTGAIKAQIYPSALASKGIQTILPSKDVQEKVLHPAIVDKEYGIKSCSNPVSARAKSDLYETAYNLVVDGAEMILSGCTEIPLALTDAHINDVPIIDPGLILARALIDTVAPEKLVQVKEIQ